jgi:hypothetical protein
LRTASATNACALVQSRYDDDYCASYTTLRNDAVAEEIIHLIRNSSSAGGATGVNHQDAPPPGRFLKRTGRANNARGLQGPWEELTERECIKKTCQALRDCNRQDRTGYAAAVAVPEDVRYNQELRSKMGLSNKEYRAMAQATRLEARAAQYRPAAEQQYHKINNSSSNNDCHVPLPRRRTTITIMQNPKAAPTSVHST